MANLKTSQETLGSVLSGTEKVRITQGGVSVYVPASYFGALASGFADVSQTFTGTVTFDLSPYAGIPEVFINGSATGNFTFNPTNGFNGQKITLRIKQSGGSKIWTSGANVRLNADIPSIVLSTADTKTDYIALRWHAADGKADVLAITKGF